MAEYTIAPNYNTNNTNKYYYSYGNYNYGTSDSSRLNWI